MPLCTTLHPRRNAPQARGIDIPNVEYVINVTFPLTVEDYCHRIG